MKIDRSLWLKQDFRDGLYGEWPCPTCHGGGLVFDKEKFLNESDGNNSRWQGSEDYDAVCAILRFVAILKCSSSICQETVAVSGMCKYDSEIDYHEELGDMWFHYPVYTPIFFYPELNIFRIPDNCPNLITTQLKLAFSHFFHDQSASANSIRTALEILMNERGVKKTFVNKHGKRDNHNLHQRIEFFGQSNPELRHYLMAAKWIGNAGSHIGKLSREDLLDGFELLQHAIDELYVKPHRLKELKSKSQAINRRKKPISIKKKNP